MKKILPFIIVLGLLAGGVFYYSGGFESLTEPKTRDYLTAEVKVQHPGWSGSIIPLENGRAQRKGHSDAGKIQNATDDSFELVWDKWDIEVYKKNPKTGVYHLFDKRKKNQPVKK